MCENDIPLCNLVEDELVKRVPDWFNKRESELLIEALKEEQLEDTLEHVVNKVNDRIYPGIEKTIGNIFCGERVRTGGKLDIADEAKIMLKSDVLEIIDEQISYEMGEYKDVQNEIKNTEAILKKLRSRFKTLNKKIDK